MNIENLRRNYLVNSLDSENLLHDPVEQFANWFDAARETPSADWFEANAMTLATSDSAGRVSARTLLLKKYSAEGFVFFTNYESDKANQLSQNPNASLLFYWPHVERQVRIEGSVTKTDHATSDEYFHERPRGSQCGAIASPQSRPLPDRDELEQMAEEIAERYAGQEIPRPEYWGGYLLNPVRFEFWQGRSNRLHDRFAYERDADGQTWKITRLAP